MRPISWDWAGQSSALTRPLPVLSHQPRRQSTFGCKTEGEKPLVKVPQLSLCPYTAASGQVRVQKIHAAHTQAPQTGGIQAPNRPACTTNYPGPTRNASSGRGWVQAAVDNQRVLACTYPRPQLTPAWCSDNLGPRSSACIGQAQRSGPDLFSCTSNSFFSLFFFTCSLPFGSGNSSLETARRPFRVSWPCCWTTPHRGANASSCPYYS